MIKTYEKTATIQAEQFDGSDETANKYNITQYSCGLQSFLPTKEGDMKLNVGDWIATGVDGEHWAIADDVFRKTYVEADK